MDTKYLEYILEIAKQKNITRAAENLYVTQSSLSQHLLKLEDELGTPLFDRAKNKLTLTDAGQMYVQAAQAVIQMKRTLYHNIASLTNEGCIRLGISSQWGIQMAADLLPNFKQQFPCITLKIYEGSFQQLKSMLGSSKIDLAVMAAGSPKDLNLPYELLRQEEIVLAIPASYPFCARHAPDRPISHEQFCTSLREESFIFSDEGSTIRLVEDELFKNLLFKPNVICELNSNRAMLSMVSKGAGIAFVPSSYVNGIDHVRIFRLDPAVCRSNVLVWRKNLKCSVHTKFLMDLIKKYPLFDPSASNKAFQQS